MKKVTSLFVALMLLLTGVNYAQSTNTAAPAPKAKTEKKAAPVKASPTSKDASAAHTKKDGTPDKRYSENKASTAKPAATHTKKDGTPDKRYKENKTAAPATK